MLFILKIRFALFALAFSTTLMVQSAQAAIIELVTNGSLTGNISNGVANPGSSLPSGWSNGVSGAIAASSPDTMDETHNTGSTNSIIAAGFGTGVTPSASPDGGTWVGISRNFGVSNENFYQEIAGFEIGKEYTLSWYDANFGVNFEFPSGSQVVYEGANKVLATLTNGSSVFSFTDVASRALGNSWYLNSFTFISTETSYTLSFGLLNPTKSYLSIDGISITTEVAAIPEPSTWMLLILGLMATGFIANRKKRAEI